MLMVLCFSLARMLRLALGDKVPDISSSCILKSMRLVAVSECQKFVVKYPFVKNDFSSYWIIWGSIITQIAFCVFASVSTSRKGMGIGDRWILMTVLVENGSFFEKTNIFSQFIVVHPRVCK